LEIKMESAQNAQIANIRTEEPMSADFAPRVAPPAWAIITIHLQLQAAATAQSATNIPTLPAQNVQVGKHLQEDCRPAAQSDVALAMGHLAPAALQTLF
jgi:hypothetical protein